MPPNPISSPLREPSTHGPRSNTVPIEDLLSHRAGTYKEIPKRHHVFAILFRDTPNEMDFAVDTIFNLAIHVLVVGKAIEVFLAFSRLFYDLNVDFNFHFILKF